MFHSWHFWSRLPLASIVVANFLLTDCIYVCISNPTMNVVLYFFILCSLKYKCCEVKPRWTSAVIAHKMSSTTWGQKSFLQFNFALPLEFICNLKSNTVKKKKKALLELTNLGFSYADAVWRQRKKLTSSVNTANQTSLNVITTNTTTWKWMTLFLMVFASNRLIN